MKRIFKISGLIALSAASIAATGLLIYNLGPVDINAKAAELENHDETVALRGTQSLLS